MKKTIRILLLSWFVIAAAYVLIGGIILSVGSYGVAVNVPSPPPLPTCPLSCDNKPAMEAAFKAYDAQVSAYGKQLAAIKARADAERPRALETYKAVAKDTIQPLLTTIVTALLGYVFVTGTTTLLNNTLLVRSGQQPERLNFL